MLSKVTVKERKVTKAPVEDEDPFNNPISKTLRDRADERRKKMKAFNYKFNTSKVDEFEKEPAYKRKGVELNDTPSSEQLPSRATVSLDENEDVQLRSNNSFLHDNVD
jgi:cell division protein FtsZ